jgi:hypothetical protein
MQWYAGSPQFLNGDLEKKSLHETTKAFFHGGEGTYGMPPKEIHLWIKASL